MTTGACDGPEVVPTHLHPPAHSLLSPSSAIIGSFGKMFQSNVLGQEQSFKGGHRVVDKLPGQRCVGWVSHEYEAVQVSKP
jgi:hypothetical protein